MGRTGLTLPLVELWSTDGPATSGLIPPDGCMDLVTDGEAVVVAGPDTTARLFLSDGSGSPMWGARFHPGLLPSLLRLHACTVTDQVVPLSDVVRTQVRPEHLRETERLWSVLPSDRVARAPLGVAADLWRGSTIEEAAQHAGWSSRQLRRLSVQWFGYGPKHLQRVLRVRRAEVLLRQGMSKTQVAAHCGYADSSHLWRDRRALL